MVLASVKELTDKRTWVSDNRVALACLPLGEGVEGELSHRAYTLAHNGSLFAKGIGAKPIATAHGRTGNLFRQLLGVNDKEIIFALKRELRAEIEAFWLTVECSKLAHDGYLTIYLLATSNLRAFRIQLLLYFLRKHDNYHVIYKRIPCSSSFKRRIFMLYKESQFLACDLWHAFAKKAAPS